MNGWDVGIPVVLWAYRTTCKKLTRQTPFMLVYGQKVVMSMDYIMSNLQIVAVIKMVDRVIIEECLVQILELEKNCFIAGFHQQV